MADWERAAWMGPVWPIPPPDQRLEIDKLKGSYALAAAQGDTLILARGRLGGHPFYYSSDGDILLACSSLDPLVRVLARAGDIDPQGLAELLLDFPAGRPTAYRGISRLCAGEVLHIGPQGIERSRRALIPSHAANTIDPDAAADELRHRITVAVDRAIGPAKRVAVSVGGLDSSALLATCIAQARGANPSEVLAVTLHFAGPDDDRPYVRDLCRALGISPIRMDPADCSRCLLSPVTIDAMPITLPQACWGFEMSRWARERSIEVIVQGEGGDQLLDGDFDLFLNDFLQGHPVRALREASRLRGIRGLRSPQRRVSKLILRPAVKRLFPPLTRLVRRARHLRHGLSSEFSWAGAALRPALDALTSIDLDHDDLATGGEILKRRDFSHNCFLYGGCRSAEPYLDEDLVSFVAALPKHLLFHGGYRRGLLRHAFRCILPDSVRLRETKSDFRHALGRTFRAAGGYALIAPYADVRALSDLGLVRPKAFRAAINRFVLDPDNSAHWVEVWPAIVLEAFLTGVNHRSAPTDAPVLAAI
jgi:asparagine synthetase B (glutamine-hydrolysing)